MTQHSITIAPEGTSHDHAHAELLHAAMMRDGFADVVSLRSPYVEQHTGGEIVVGWIHDFGRTMGLPVNRKAWMLYGRSPICGPMVVRMDNDAVPLPEALVDMLRLPLDEWCEREHIDRMNELLEAEGMAG